MSFTELNLDPALVKRLRRSNIIEPTPIQAQAIPTLIEGRDVIALAPTGSGKSIAFLAPLAHRMLQEGAAGANRRSQPSRRARKRRRKARAEPARGGNAPRALIITPTRELAEQIAGDAVRLAGGSGLRIVTVVGGVGARPQEEAIAAGVDLLVATPGRLRDLVEAGAVSLASIAHLVLDEADRMLDMGFQPQVDSIVERLGPERQTALFTASMSPAVEALAQRYLNQPVRLEIGEHTRTAAHVVQRLFPVAEHLKVKLILRLLEDEAMEGVLIFARTRRRVGWIAAALDRHAISVAALHGDRTQAQRRRALDRFRNGEVRVIVATDVAARGLHVEAVRTVINYDLPTQPEEYVHRVGRAGHGGVIPGVEAEGTGITLLDPRDADDWERIQGVVRAQAAPETLAEFEYDEPKRGAGKVDTREKPPGAARPSSDRPNRPRKYRKGTKEHVPPKVAGKPKRRHSASRPIRGSEKPGRGVAGGEND